jgi:uncharacterized membrane protein HdeD (DUF308 family)
MVVYIELIMHRKPLNLNKIIEYQKALDESDKRALEKYGLDWKHDAFTELMAQRKQSKAFTGIFSGVAMVFVLIAFIFVTHISPANVIIICTSGLLLMCYGMIKLAENRWFAVGLLAFIFIVGTLGQLAFEKMMTMDPYAYFYLCGLILLIGILSLIPRVKKFAEKH